MHEKLQKNIFGGIIIALFATLTTIAFAHFAVVGNLPTAADLDRKVDSDEYREDMHEIRDDLREIRADIKKLLERE